MAVAIQQQLAGLLGGDAVVPAQRLGLYAVDGIVPQAAVLPPDRRAVAEVLRWASRERVSVFPRGGGTRMALGNAPGRVDLVLGLGRLDNLLDYQPADLTATVEAGITLQRLQQRLAPGGKFLPLESPLSGIATIGGILASNASGPLRSAYGLPRDWLIGIATVSAGGVETRAGGRVVKNVTGYDLDKLYAGSLGTLGVIVEASFKLSPVPAGSRALVAEFPSLRQGIMAAGRLMGQAFAPQGVQVVDGQVARRLNKEQGVALFGRLAADGALALLFTSGSPRAVERRLDEGTRFLREAGAMDVSGLDREQGLSMIGRIADLGWSADTRPCLSIRAGVPPSKAARVAEVCQRDCPLAQPPGVVADPGCGVVRLLWWDETAEESAVLGAIARTRDLVRGAGGSAVVEHCPLPAKRQIDVWGDEPAALDVMRRVKQKFDPLGILNPGRFVGRM